MDTHAGVNMKREVGQDLGHRESTLRKEGSTKDIELIDHQGVTVEYGHVELRAALQPRMFQ